jgi:hypothetical protein
MSASSVRRLRKAPSRSKAVTCVVVNQFATPGLGSVVGRRFVSGAGQLLLSLAGFCLIVTWMVCRIYDSILEAVGQETGAHSNGWMAKWGLISFGGGWLWALVTSLSLLRQAKENERAVPPRISEPPPAGPGAAG